MARVHIMLTFENIYACCAAQQRYTFLYYSKLTGGGKVISLWLGNYLPALCVLRKVRYTYKTYFTFASTGS